MRIDLPSFTDQQIRAARPARNHVDATRPYAFLVEPELSSRRVVDHVATVFLTGRECPLTCLMCDLWKNTTTETVPVGAIPAQIDYALERLPAAEHIKLYNSSNFFDPGAIPVADYPAIVERARAFQSVIVENHPRFCGRRCIEFRDLLGEHNIELEVALGLETVHPQVLPRLNKQMTLDDFREAVSFLTENEIRVRSFILLRPPFLSEREGIDWAERSVEFAFDCGVSCVAIIPTRAGNGIMEQLQSVGQFEPPTLRSLEVAFENSLGSAGSDRRVFVDLWDAGRLAGCQACIHERVARLRLMNDSQQIEPLADCDVCATS